jgi:hypothetical protein
MRAFILRSLGLGLSITTFLGCATTPEPVEEDTGMPEPPTKTAPNLNDHFAMVAEALPDFGGMYFDEEGHLRVYVLDPDPGRTSQVRAVLGRVFGEELFVRSDNERRPVRRVEVYLVEGRYPFLQLLEWFRAIDRVLDIEGVWFKEIDERTNRLTIGIEDLALEPRVQSVLAEVGVPLEAVIIEETEPIEVHSHSLVDHVRPSVGGIIGLPCTVGFNAIRGGVRGFVTNSHCTRQMGSVTGAQFFNHMGGGDHLLGVEVVDPPYWDCKTWHLGPTRACRFSDAAFIRYDGRVTSSLGRIARTHFWRGPGQGPGDRFINHASPTFPIPSNANPPYPFKGEMVDKIGSRTGWTYGFVNKTCADANTPGEFDGKTIRLLCQDRANYTSDQGDSGSPVFLWYGDRVQLLGVHVGRSGSNSWFSALWNIREDIGAMTTHSP